MKNSIFKFFIIFLFVLNLQEVWSKEDTYNNNDIFNPDNFDKNDVPTFRLSPRNTFDLKSKIEAYFNDKIEKNFNDFDVNKLVSKEINIFLYHLSDFDNINKKMVCSLSENKKKEIISNVYDVRKNNLNIHSWEHAYHFMKEQELVNKIKAISRVISIGIGSFALFSIFSPIYKPFINKWINKIIFKLGIKPEKKENIELINNINEYFFGYKDLKKKINQIISKLLKMKKDKKLSFINGAIFYGEAGCGKTYMVELISRFTDLPLFNISLSQIINEFRSVGKNIELIFEKVQSYVYHYQTPVILFLDEIDMILPSRTVQSTLTQEEKILLQDFLTLLCNTKGIFVIGNTNHIERIDNSILRDGRLGIHINFGLPSRSDIVEILKNLCKQKKIKFLSDFDVIVDKLVGLNVASINNFLDNYIDYIKEKNLLANLSSLNKYIDEYGI